MHFERFAVADRVVVTIESKSVGNPIVDLAKIHDVVVFAEIHSDDWSVDAMGPPVARLRVDFYQGGRFLGDFGVGAEFASAQGCDDFQSRTLLKSEVAQFAQLLGVAESEAKWK